MKTIEKIDKIEKLFGAFKNGKYVIVEGGYNGNNMRIDSVNQLLHWINRDIDRLYIEEEYGLNSYRPYKNAQEFRDAMKEHGQYLRYILGDCDNFHPMLFPVGISDNYIIDYACTKYEYGSIIKMFVWEDGTPCGVLKK